MILFTCTFIFINLNLFITSRGKNVLNQKSELEKALQERKLRKQKDESATELEMKIANQKNHLVEAGSSSGNEELLRIRSNLNKNKSNNDI